MAAKEAAKNLMFKPPSMRTIPSPLPPPSQPQYSPTELQQASEQGYRLDHRGWWTSFFFHKVANGSSSKPYSNPIT
jgi:hypothetical protein